MRSTYESKRNPTGRGDPCGSAHTWALVLAGGDGTRLHGLIRSSEGIPIPKQFFSLRGGVTLLQQTLERAQSIVPRNRICTVLSERHRQWWEPLLRSLPGMFPIIQPDNRGTGIGILFPLLHILYRDPHAKIVVLPCDHYVDQEEALALALHEALVRVQSRNHNVVLLGMEPESPDPELGYIVPGRTLSKHVTGIECFVEKPTMLRAQELIARGALWNAFIIAASAQGLLRLFEGRQNRAITALRELVTLDLCGKADFARAVAIFDLLPRVDFSQDILTVQASSLHLQRVPHCGWSDLGTPRRMSAVLRRIEQTEDRSMSPEIFAAQTDLAAQSAQR